MLIEIYKRIRQDVKNYGLGLIGFLLYYIIVQKIFRASCPMVIVSGLPCPGCGMTRAIRFLVTGQWERSFRMNPTAILWLLFLLWFIWCRYIKGTEVKGWKPIIVILCILLLVVYVYRMATIFPNRAPMTYRRNNILSSIVPFYNEVLHSIFSMW